MSHTPEPWNVEEYSDGRVRGCTAIRTTARKNSRYIVLPTQGISGKNTEEADANAARIVACVNGCANLNPAAYIPLVETVRQLVKNLRAIQVSGEKGYSDFQPLAEALALAEGRE